MPLGRQYVKRERAVFGQRTLGRSECNLIEVGMLGLFGIRPFVDNELGTFHRKGGYWKGVIHLKTQADIPLLLSGTATAPNAKLLALAGDLLSRLDALSFHIQKALFEHHEPYRDSWKSGGTLEQTESFPDIQSEADVWQYVSVAHILIEPVERVPTIEIGYRVGWDEEHTVGARIRDWKLANFNGSVRRRH